MKLLQFLRYYLYLQKERKPPTDKESLSWKNDHVIPKASDLPRMWNKKYPQWLVFQSVLNFFNFSIVYMVFHNDGIFLC